MMQFDPGNPTYFAWLTSEAGKEQQITRVGPECSEQQLQDILIIQNRVGYVRGFISDTLGIIQSFEGAHRLDDDIAQSTAERKILAINMPATLLAHAEAQQKLDNLLAACSAFISRGQTRIRRTFGETSDQYIAFEADRSHEYDTKLSYRIMQNLRNFSQHENAPISLIPTTLKPEEGGLTVSTKVLLDRRELIASTRVQSRVRRELSDLDHDQIDVISLINEYYESFMIIAKKSLTDLVSDLQSHCRPYLDIYGPQPVENISVPILFRLQQTEDSTRFHISYPPMQELAIFDYILNSVLSAD